MIDQIEAQKNPKLTLGGCLILKEKSHIVIMSENKPYEFLNDFIRLDTGEFAQIARMPNLDALIDGQVSGLTWLDSVDHLLEKYEDDSRTEAFSGFALE